MGFLGDVWDGIKGAGKSIGGAVAGIPGSLIGGAADMLGSWFSNKYISQPNAEDAFRMSEAASARAFDRSYGAYKSRYQDTMADMRAAGLNPILAAGSGGFNVGSAPQMKPATAPLPVVKDHQFSSSAKNVADTGEAVAKTSKVFREVQKVRAETLNTLEQIEKTRAEKGLVTQNERNALKEMRNIEADWFVKVQTFNKITQEGYLTNAKKHLVREQEKLIKKQVERLKLTMEQLKKTAGVYAGPGGALIAYINEVMNALNLNLGVFGGIKK